VLRAEQGKAVAWARRLTSWSIQKIVSRPVKQNASGLLMLLSSRLRFLAAYVILGSTFGLIVSFLISTATLLLRAKLMAGLGFNGSLGGIVSILGYLSGIVAGGAVGIVVGALTAHRVNRWAGLSKTN